MTRAALYSLFPLGLSFWFFLAFPFANRNESYIWLEPLESRGFFAIMEGQLPPYSQIRPLAHGTAWVLYRLAGHSIWAVQLFNYLGAAAAWMILGSAMKEKWMFALTALAVGGCLFPGYIYLFNLHGVFYSPMLVLIAAMLAARSVMWTGSRPVALAIGALAAAMFHSYALLLYGAFLVGALLEDRRSIGSRRFAVGLGMALVAFALARILSLDPDASKPFSSAGMRALLVSYQATEVNRLLSVVSAALTLAVVASLQISWRRKPVALAAAAGVCAAACGAGIPVIMVWVLACLVKTLLMRRWSLALLLTSAALFPMVRNSGSPTYAVFALMICAAVLPMTWSAAESRLGWLNGRFAASAVVCAAVLVICLRAGLAVPIFSKAARPILAEKEKTWQLEQIIDWILRSRYSNYAVALNRPAERTMDDLKSAVNRERRAPTSGKYLDPYLDWRRGSRAAPTRKLLVCFGNDEARGRPILYSVEGRHAGKAIVYLDTTRRESVIE